MKLSTALKYNVFIWSYRFLTIMLFVWTNCQWFKNLSVPYGCFCFLLSPTPICTEGEIKLTINTWFWVFDINISLSGSPWAQKWLSVCIFVEQLGLIKGSSCTDSRPALILIPDRICSNLQKTCIKDRNKNFYFETLQKFTPIFWLKLLSIFK